MSKKVIALVGLALLAACGPRAIPLADGQCRSLQVGDRVEGSAILSAYVGNVCVECGTRLSRAGCAGDIGFRNANDRVDNDYRRIVQNLPLDAEMYDFVKGRVFVSGTVVRSADGSLSVSADAIRNVDR